MKKLLILLFSILLSFNSYGEEELDFSLDTFCNKSPKAQLRNGLFFLPNQKKPYSGENVCIYLSNGQYFSQGKIKNGLKTGKWSYWFENGEEKLTRNYKDGIEVKPICIPVEEWSYIDVPYSLPNEDKPFTGKSECRTEEGDSIWSLTLSIFKNGIKVSHNDTMYHESGRKLYSNNFGKEYLQVGKQTMWFNNGQIEKEENYNNDGILDGRFAEWYANGQQKIEITYNKEFPIGKFAEWKENGDLDSEGFIDENGDGKSTDWWGDTKVEKNLKNYKLDGKRTYWNENGQIESESNWKDGECISGDCPD